MEHPRSTFHEDFLRRLILRSTLIALVLWVLSNLAIWWLFLVGRYMGVDLAGIVYVPLKDYANVMVISLIGGMLQGLIRRHLDDRNKDHASDSVHYIQVMMWLMMYSLLFLMPAVPRELFSIHKYMFLGILSIPVLFGGALVHYSYTYMAFGAVNMKKWILLFLAIVIYGLVWPFVVMWLGEETPPAAP